jgi:NAD-dependent dihydropyrimidine dehydrogenase PreA subunit
MQGLRYLEEAVTLGFDAEKCTGCQVCTIVCPHGVFAMGADKRAYVADRGACMECGACALNCAWGAISVKPGVGCAEAIIHSWIYGGEPTCGCSTPGPATVRDGGAASATSACCGSAPVTPRELPTRDATASAPACGCGPSSCGTDADAAPPAPGAA